METYPIPELPMPGDVFAGITGSRPKTVIASCWGNDTPDEYAPVVFGTLLFLRHESPFYEIAQVEPIGPSWMVTAGTEQLHMNIVFAAAAYQDATGCV